MTVSVGQVNADGSAGDALATFDVSRSAQPNTSFGHGFTGDGPLNLTGLGFSFGGSNTFFYDILVSAEITITGNHAPNQSMGGQAIIFFGAPDFTLYDAQGNDITANYVLARQAPLESPPVTATPEPASVTLIATGLAGLGGWRARRRRVRVAS